MSDQETMWELNVLQLLKRSSGWTALTNKPQIIGPDRATAEHTVNTIESFGPDHTYIRPDYTSLVDIIGTQARYVDTTATSTNYSTLS